MQGWNAGSITIGTDATAYTIGVAGRPTRVYNVFCKGAANCTGGTLQLFNGSSAGTEMVMLNVNAMYSSDTTNWIDFSPYGLLFKDTCYAKSNSALTYSTIVYEVLP